MVKELSQYCSGHSQTRLLVIRLILRKACHCFIEIVCQMVKCFLVGPSAFTSRQHSIIVMVPATFTSFVVSQDREDRANTPFHLPSQLSRGLVTFCNLCNHALCSIMYWVIMYSVRACTLFNHVLGNHVLCKSIYYTLSNPVHFFFKLVPPKTSLKYP